MVSILFVCHANICRSPLAEGLLRLRAEEAGWGTRLQVDSAGVQAISGIAPHPYSVEVARARGASLRGPSRQLVRRDLERFDQIFLMDRRNRHWLDELLPPQRFGPIENFPARVRMLGELLDAEKVPDLDDPIGSEIETYEACAQTLETAIASLLEELAPLRTDPQS